MKREIQTKFEELFNFEYGQIRDELDGLIFTYTFNRLENMIEKSDEEISVDKLEEMLPLAVEAAIDKALAEGLLPNHGYFYTKAKILDMNDHWFYNLEYALKNYYTSAITEHNAKACYDLGVIYRGGQMDEKNNYVVKKNYSYAAMYFAFSVFFGESKPDGLYRYFYHLAEMYFFGWGVRQSFETVIKIGDKADSVAGNDVDQEREFYREKLINLVMAAMNLSNSSIDYDKIPDYILDNIDEMGYVKGINPTGLEILNSKQAKIEILLSRRKMKSSGEYLQKCPKCNNGTMLMRYSNNPKGNKYPIFLGCSEYPSCTHIIEGLPNIE